ncbi:MAG: DUF1475 domain-containing protein [Candidatus Sumerlaeaceae bacterium]|nr:DUF1475 domain-containing protein [Candidatus Sumerlaeaceae bacterium]
MNPTPGGTARPLSSGSKAALVIFGLVVLGLMLWTTTTASLRQAIWDVGEEYWGNPWAVATLLDAYFAFLFFCLWVVYKEQHWVPAGAWVLAILLTGSMGMALYLLIQVVRLRPGDGVRHLLLRRGEV